MTEMKRAAAEGEEESGADAPGALAGEFVCPGCGRPLRITLHSDRGFAEAPVYCPEYERAYQERRGPWAPKGDAGV